MDGDTGNRLKHNGPSSCSGPLVGKPILDYLISGLSEFDEDKALLQVLNASQNDWFWQSDLLPVTEKHVTNNNYV